MPGLGWAHGHHHSGTAQLHCGQHVGAGVFRGGFQLKSGRLISACHTRAVELGKIQAPALGEGCDLFHRPAPGPEVLARAGIFGRPTSHIYVGSHPVAANPARVAHVAPTSAAGSLPFVVVWQMCRTCWGGTATHLAARTKTISQALAHSQDAVHYCQARCQPSAMVYREGSADTPSVHGMHMHTRVGSDRGRAMAGGRIAGRIFSLSMPCKPSPALRSGLAACVPPSSTFSTAARE